jgi:hypothetical protein
VNLLGRGAGADLEIARRRTPAIDEMMAVGGMGRKTRRHAGPKHGLAFIGHERHFPFE